MGLMAKLVRIMWVPVLISLMYLGWVFWQRHASEPAPKAARPVDNPLAKYGSGVKILQFYADTGEIGRGGRALLCYGVVNARAVRLDPPEETIGPSLSRCFYVSPKHSTRYTLTAEGADGKPVSESVEIAVKH
jgi:hypothetical protein